MRRVVLLRRAFNDLQDVRRDSETYSMDMLEDTMQAIVKAQKQYKKDRYFRRADTDEFVGVLEEIFQDLALVQRKLKEGT